MSGKRLCALVLIAAATGCSREESDGKIKAVATVAMISDIVREVGGERVTVTGLMAAGVDPHTYKASESDVRTLSDAQIIFYNGLGLEGRMGDLFVRMSRTRPTVPVTEDIDKALLTEPPQFEGHYDPHVWMDVTLWIHAVRRVQRGLAELDPKHADEYKLRADAYIKKLEELDAYVTARIAEIPESRRVLVTAHDAFGYFGRRYKIRVEAIQGVSTADEATPNDVSRVADQVMSRGVKAIFVESSVNPKNIEAVQAACRAKGHDIKTGGELYSDAMGTEGTPEGTYLGMIRHNADTIVKALK